MADARLTEAPHTWAPRFEPDGALSKSWADQQTWRSGLLLYVLFLLLLLLFLRKRGFALFSTPYKLFLARSRDRVPGATTPRHKELVDLYQDGVPTEN